MVQRVHCTVVIKLDFAWSCELFTRWCEMVQMLKFIQLSLSVSHSHARILHDHANWGRNSFCTFPKLWKLSYFWHELPCFWHECVNWCWAIKTPFSFASCIPFIQKVLQNSIDMIKKGSFIKTKKNSNKIKEKQKKSKKKNYKVIGLVNLLED